MQHQFKLHHTTPDRKISVFAHRQPIHHTLKTHSPDFQKEFLLVFAPIVKSTYLNEITPTLTQECSSPHRIKIGFNTPVLANFYESSIGFSHLIVNLSWLDLLLYYDIDFYFYKTLLIMVFIKQHNKVFTIVCLFYRT